MRDNDSSTYLNLFFSMPFLDLSSLALSEGLESHRNGGFCQSVHDRARAALGAFD